MRHLLYLQDNKSSKTSICKKEIKPAGVIATFCNLQD